MSEMLSVIEYEIMSIAKYTSVTSTKHAKYKRKKNLRQATSLNAS